MDNFDTIVAILNEVDPEAAEYVQWVLDNPEEHQHVSTWPVEAAREHVADNPLPGSAYGLCTWDMTPQGHDYWDTLWDEFGDRYNAWFN